MDCGGFTIRFDGDAYWSGASNGNPRKTDTTATFSPGSRGGFRHRRPATRWQGYPAWWSARWSETTGEELFSVSDTHNTHSPVVSYSIAGFIPSLLLGTPPARLGGMEINPSRNFGNCGTLFPGKRTNSSLLRLTNMAQSLGVSRVALEQYASSGKARKMAHYTNCNCPLLPTKPRSQCS